MTTKRVIRPLDYPWDPGFDFQPYSLAVERNGLLCVSGLTAETHDPARGRRVVNSTDLVEQTEVIFQKMGAILNAAGYSFEDVVYTVDYALEAAMPGYRASGAVRRRSFGPSMPASVGVIVDGIPNSSSLLTVSATAMRGGREKRGVFPEGTPTWERYRSRTFWPGFFVGDDWFWLSGSTGKTYDEATGQEAYPPGIISQAQAIWRGALGQVMRDASVDAARTAKTFDYIHPAGLEEYAGAQAVRGSWTRGGETASTSLVISRLLHREAMLETDALCYLGEDREVIRVPGWRERARGTPTPPAAVRCGKLLFCSGQGPVDHATGDLVGRGDFEAQMCQTYENLFQVLQAAGAGAGDVVRTLEFTDPQNAYRQDILSEARRRAFGDSLPAVTTITANQVLPTGANFGMEAWAVLE